MDIDHYVTQYAGAWGLPISWAFFRFWHNQAQINFAPSRATGQQLITNGIKHVTQWQRGIDLARFRQKTIPPDLRLQLTNGNPHQCIALYVGRLSREKDIAALLPLTQLDNVQLVLVGGGPETERTKALFAHTNALFVGVLHGEALIDMYNCADIFVFPSQSETFGLAPLEAMACGLPVVAPYVGGLTETMHHMHNGLVFDHLVPDDIVRCVMQLRDDAVLRKTLATQAHAYAQQRDWQHTMDTLVDYYEALAKGDSHATP
jgi:glycosyltransferase involved in cell wall biosynthesis